MNFFVKYEMPLGEIKYFNAIVDNKSFFGEPVKNSKKCMYEKLAKISRNNDYTTGNLFDYFYR